MPAEVRPRGNFLAGAMIALAGCASAPAPPTALPLDDLRAAIGTATEDRRREASVAFEEALAQCLHEKGFEYVPEPWASDAELPAEDARDFAARWGYGISTAPTTPIDADVPPMSAAEAEAYASALYGEWAAPDEGDPGAGSPGGCWETANAARGGDPDHAAVAATAGLAGELEILEARIAVDPRVADQNRAWSGCMADAGFDIATPADAPQAAISAGRAVEAAASDPAAPRVLADVQDLERRIAVADLACQDDVDLAGTVRRVRAEHEAEFVDWHGPEIEALIAILNEAASPAGTSG